LRLALAALLAVMALAGCDRVTPDADRPETSRAFPRADRPVAEGSGSGFASEVQRDRVNEAQRVMTWPPSRRA
jgi:hypothetical protein